MQPTLGIASLLRRVLPALLPALLMGACLAPPPPIIVETPFGDVRARSEKKASEVARMLEDLAPKVQRILPGSLDRTIDIWVQEELQVYRFRTRPESVRGFTLLSGEFSAKRIHLQESGQSPWYLAHELVHALIGPSWSPLPGVLEEGLGDVVAEQLNQNSQFHIRAHRLLNASAFTDGLEFDVVYRVPDETVGVADWKAEQCRARMSLSEARSFQLVEELLETSRSDLHDRWHEIPESFYGFAWLVVSRIVEREGLEGLHDLCLKASAEGHEIIPSEWLFEAAELDPQGLSPRFLASCFEEREFTTAILLQPKVFGDLALASIEPLRGRVGVRQLLRYARPAFVLNNGRRIDWAQIPKIRERIARDWPSGPNSARTSATGALLGY